MNRIKELFQWLVQMGTSFRLALLTAFALVCGLAVPAQASGYTDPAADINAAVAGAGAGASTAYISTLTVLASVVIVGLVIWGLRKGVRPR